MFFGSEKATESVAIALRKRDCQDSLVNEHEFRISLQMFNSKYSKSVNKEACLHVDLVEHVGHPLIYARLS